MFMRQDRRTEDERFFNPSTVDTDLDAGSPAIHDNGLIDRLKSDHAELLDRLHDIDDQCMHNQFVGIPGQLAAFLDCLQAHLQEENTKLYAPLHARHASDPADVAVLAHEESRMAGIARMVLIFVKRYIESGVHAGNRDAFARDLEVIESLLADRIDTEESTLYPLYRAE